MTINLDSTGDINDLIHYRIECCDNTLKESDCLAQFKMWPGALNRLYYACYYIVVALLLKKGIAVKTHAGVRTMFSLHFVKEGIVSSDSGKFYHSLFDLRHLSDYDDQIVCDEETYRLSRKDADMFLEETKRVLDHLK
ncbi:MAG: HEPN domain-containing protein [Muribaculaceae bacterium]|nr:HEPN domain-containing protein [Muribaculaceae bacterium]